MAKVAYDGTNYHGFQIQPSDDTVQERIEKALEIIYKQDIRINYSGRTDTGVHAFSQYIDFISPFDSLECHNLMSALNSLLPKDIRILNVEYAPEGFHSRYSAIFRDYVYFVYNRNLPTPFFYRYAWHILDVIDIDKMKRAKHVFEGKKDFYFTANEPKDKNCIRRVHFIHIKKIRGFIIVHIRADGFLRGMVRNIVGSLVAISKNILKIDTINNIIQQPAEIKSHKAPPNGLFLTKVHYQRSVK